MDVIIPPSLDDLKATEKNDALKEIVEALVVNGTVPAKKAEEVIKVAISREELSSTGIINGVAIPHIRLNEFGEMICVVARSKIGIDFNSQDGGMTHLIFFVIAEKSNTSSFLEFICHLSMLARDTNKLQLLIDARDADEIIGILKQS